MRLSHALTRPGNAGFGAQLGRGTLCSSLCRTCFGRRLSSVRHTWPAHCRRQCL